MRFIGSILKLDYSLSEWFSKTNQTIIPGTAFLFLNKLAFLLAAIYFIVLPILPFRLGLEMAIGVLCGLTLLVMYSLQTRLQTIVKNLNYSIEYSKIDNAEKVLQRILGLALFTGCFILMFVIGVFFFSGYGK